MKTFFLRKLKELKKPTIFWKSPTNPLPQLISLPPFHALDAVPALPIGISSTAQSTKLCCALPPAYCHGSTVLPELQSSSMGITCTNRYDTSPAPATAYILRPAQEGLPFPHTAGTRSEDRASHRIPAAWKEKAFVFIYS